MSEYLVSFLISYLIGSFPTAFIVVKQTSRLDIRTAGSGNVGGRNALEVTGKKWVGAAVVLIDVMKGAASIAAAQWWFPGYSVAYSAAMAGAVTGHCYPVWLRFRGGRGLATAAGVFLMAHPVWPAVWLMVYFTAQKLTGNVHRSSVIALAGLPVIGWLVPDHLTAMAVPASFTVESFLAAATFPMAVCISRHIKPLMGIDETHAP